MVDELDGGLTPVSVRLGVEELATLDAVAEEWRESRSGVFRRLLLTMPRASLAESGGTPELGRVQLTFAVRPESVAWMDAKALAWGWTREQVARLAFSEGRRVVDLKGTKANAGERVPGWGPRERAGRPVVAPGADRVPEPPPPVDDPVDAPQPA